MVHCHNSGFIVRFLSNFAQWKGPQVDESNNNGLYPEKCCSGQMGCFGPKNGAHPHNSESTLRFFYKNFADWKGLIGTWKLY